MTIIFALLLIFSAVFLGILLRAWLRGEINVKVLGEVDRDDSPILFHIIMVWFSVVGLVLFGVSAIETARLLPELVQGVLEFLRDGHNG